MFGRLKTSAKAAFDSKLPFEILEECRPLEQKYLEEKGTSFPSVSANKFVYDLKLKMGAKVAVVINFIILIFLLVCDLLVPDNEGRIVALLFEAVLFISALYFLYRIYQNKQGFIVLDREKGLITFPVGLRRDKELTSPFNTIVVFWQGTGGATGNLDMKLLGAHTQKKGAGYLEGLDRDYRKLWSFYVWYMDKNRPLPPGSAFDPYREADYERRKAEGFPKPLYRSHISTPEATPEQQAERDRHWQEQIEEFTREKDSKLYDPSVHQDWIAVRYTDENKVPLANIFWRFEFEDGEVVYMKTNENGSGHEPPGQNYKMSQMKLYESLF